MHVKLNLVLLPVRPDEICMAAARQDALDGFSTVLFMLRST